MNQKSVDFVLCDKQMETRLAIELDGDSHKKQSSIDSDNEKRRVLDEIKLPLLRFNNNEINIDTKTLANKIRTTIYNSRLHNI